MSRYPTDMSDRRSKNDARDFPYTGLTLMWGDSHWSDVYAIAPDIRDWDKPPAEINAAIGSYHGFYSYVRIRVTGRGLIMGPRGMGGAYKVKMQSVTPDPTSGEYKWNDEWDGYIMAKPTRGKFVTIEDVRAILDAGRG